MTVARKLANYSLRLSYDDLPGSVVHEVKRALLDTLGCAIGAYPSKTSQIIRNLIRELGGPKESTVIGSGLQTSCLNALLANGVMVRYLDFNDTYQTLAGKDISGGHPSEVIPTVLALGERNKCSGAEIIAAIVLGYELSARFIDCSVNPTLADPTIEAKGWNADTRGIFVMPAVAGKLIGLNEAQMEHAIGISGSHNMILGILDAPGEEYNMTKNLRFPRTAYGAVMAAFMAQKGFTGPTRVIEGNKGFVQTVMGGDFNTRMLTRSAKKFKILDTIYKSAIGDATTQGHLTATLQLVKEHNIKPEAVDAVRITAGSRSTEHTGDEVKRFPKNKETADHSSFYLTAIAITDRAVGPDQFTVKKYADAGVRRLIRKVSMVADPDLDRFGRAGLTEIRIKGGTTFKRLVKHPKGDPKNPMTDEELEKKFRAMAEKFMTQKKIDKVIASVYKIEELDDIGKLMKTLIFEKKR